MSTANSGGRSPGDVVRASGSDRRQVHDRPLVVGALEADAEVLVVVQIDVALGVDRWRAAGRHRSQQHEYTVVQDWLAVCGVVDRLGLLVDEADGGEVLEPLDD